MDASFQTHFSSLPDPRIERTKRYPLIEIVFLVITATISGSEGWKAIKDFGDIKLAWLRQFLAFKEGIPIDSTTTRVLVFARVLSCHLSYYLPFYCSR